MEQARGSLTAQAEVLLRLLAAAVNAVRLYPPASPMRTDAMNRFADEARRVTSANGPLQLHVDRRRFILADTPIGEGAPQVAALAETLHALQVGQLILAPGLTADETSSFVDVLGSETSTIRDTGGLRAALLEAKVANIAVIEVSLRASSEEGLLGLDLTMSPMEDVAQELKDAAARWAESAKGEGSDEIAEAVGRLEPAAQDLAMHRCAEALLLIDEPTRLEMLSSALPGEPPGPAMDGLLEVIAHMPPAALARLLRLTAQSQQEGIGEILDAIAFPPELAEELNALLKPSPQTDEQRGVPPEADVESIAAEVAAADENDLEYIGTLVKATTSRSAAARGLATTIAMAREQRTEESVQAIAEAIQPAVRERALDDVAIAADFLDELAKDPGLTASVQSARSAFRDPSLLALCAQNLAAGAASDAPRTMLQEAGAPGAEALVSAYLGADETRRARLRPALGTMIESVAPVAGRILRAGDTDSAIAGLQLLGSLESRRLAPTIAAALENLDSRVREAAVVALAESPGPECSGYVQKALTHWDPETRRIAAREIGRTGNKEALPALLKIVSEASMFEKNYELKKEVLKSLEVLHSPEAIPVLKRLTGRITIDKKSRELRYLARRVLESLE
ncbi:MAG: HEAT repeat domain-containing protein [Armatimonadetes bacterium]|nr:HEAT repeat domain-containing protein [Armatimonadota bacterium]